MGHLRGGSGDKLFYSFLASQAPCISGLLGFFILKYSRVEPQISLLFSFLPLLSSFSLSYSNSFLAMSFISLCPSFLFFLLSLLLPYIFYLLPSLLSCLLLIKTYMLLSIWSWAWRQISPWKCAWFNLQNTSYHLKDNTQRMGVWDVSTCRCIIPAHHDAYILPLRHIRMF